MNKLSSSKRFWAVITGIVVVLVSNFDIGITPETATKIVVLISTWVAGETVRPINTPTISS